MIHTPTLSLARLGQGLLALAVVPALSAQLTTAQPGPGANWTGWMGCWEPVVAEGISAPTQTAAVCITPAPNGSADAVVLSNVANGRVAERTTLVANGQRQTSEREGCRGWESMEWAKTGQRLYYKSQHVCEGGIERNSTAMLSLSPTEWVDVRRVATSGTTGIIRAVHYRAADLTHVPADLVRQIPADLGMSVAAARLATQADVSINDVVDAVKQVGGPVVEAWLVERGQRFTLDSKQLVKLAEAKVPSGVIDVMVAVSYPSRFALDHADYQGELRAPADNRLHFANPEQRAAMSGYPGHAYDPFWDFAGYGSYYDSYGRLRNGYGSRGYYYGSQPVIVYIRDDSAPASGGGTAPGSRPAVVNGKGYTRNNEPSTSTSSGSSGSSTGSASTSRTSGSSGSSGGSSSSGAASSSGGASSSGDARTARPKTCTPPNCQ